MRLASLLLAVYFFAGSLIPTSDWDELPRIYNLLEHYKEHQQRNEQRTLSFMDFLSMHYHANSGHRQQEDHSQLPFTHACPTVVIAIVQAQTFKIQPVEKPAEYVLFNSTLNPREHSFSLFQPPRV